MDRIKAKIARNQVIEGNEVTAMVFFLFKIKLCLISPIK